MSDRGQALARCRPELRPLTEWLWDALDASSVPSRNALAEKSGWDKGVVYAAFEGRRLINRGQSRDLAVSLGADPAEADRLWREARKALDDSARASHAQDIPAEAALPPEAGGRADLEPRERGASGSPRRAAILAAAAAIAIAAVIISVVVAAPWRPGHGAGASQPAGSGLSVQDPPWATAGSGRREDTFTAGGGIRYAFEVYNSTGKAVSANVRFDAYWGARDQRPVNIFDVLFQQVIPPGRVTVYSPPASVPGDALPGTYTEQADVADRADPADRAGHYGSFNVAGTKLLSVPYLTQLGARPGSAQDGLACVAMILASRSGPQRPAIHDIQEIISASGPHRAPADAARPVSGEELEYALERYGVPEAAISQISLDEPGLPQAQVTKIAIAIKQGSPVIAFTNGKDLPAGRAGNRSYTGHWLVVVGFGFDRANGAQILVNDPDKMPGHGGIRGQPISIGAFEQAVAGAADVPAAQQEPDHIAGIIVTPSRNS